AGMTEILFLLSLATCHSHLGRVDHDDVVTSVHVRREDRLVFAANDPGDLCRETPEDHTVGIHDEPTLLDIRGRCGERFHCLTRTKWDPRLTGAGRNPGLGSH